MDDSQRSEAGPLSAVRYGEIVADCMNRPPKE